MSTRHRRRRKQHTWRRLLHWKTSRERSALWLRGSHTPQRCHPQAQSKFQGPVLESWRRLHRWALLQPRGDRQQRTLPRLGARPLQLQRSAVGSIGSITSRFAPGPLSVAFLLPPPLLLSFCTAAVAARRGRSHIGVCTISSVALLPCNSFVSALSRPAVPLDAVAVSFAPPNESNAPDHDHNQSSCDTACDCTCGRTLRGHVNVNVNVGR